MHTCIHACIHTYIHTCMHTCIRACIFIQLYKHIKTETCVHTCVYKKGPNSFRWLCVHTHICLCVYTHTYVYIFIYVFIYVFHIGDEHTTKHTSGTNHQLCCTASAIWAAQFFWVDILLNHCSVELGLCSRLRKARVRQGLRHTSLSASLTLSPAATME